MAICVAVHEVLAMMWFTSLSTTPVDTERLEYMTTKTPAQQRLSCDMWQQPINGEGFISSES